MSLPDIGFGSKTNHDQLGGATYPRYMVMYAERKETSDSTPNDEDPAFGFRGATTHTTGTDAKVYMGILNGVLPSPEHNITVSNLSAGIVIETDRITVKPGIILDPIAQGSAPAVAGSLIYNTSTGELNYHDSGGWNIVSAGGLSSHVLDGAYHTATGLTVGWVISADSATTFSWKAPTGGGADPDAIHDNVADEITAITPKTTLGSTDEFVLEDGGASFVKKAVTFANIESSISLANLGTRTHASLSDAPADAHHVAFVLADFTTAFAAESLANLTARAHSDLSDAPTSAHHVRYADSEAVAAVEVDTSLVLSGTVRIASAVDGKLELQATDVGGTPGTPEGGWNYIEFLDMDGDRQGYFGIHSAGHFTFAPEVAGAQVRVGADLYMYAHDIVSVGLVDGVDVSTFKTAYDTHDGGDVETYHTNYYTDTDVEGIITAEIVDGQSIDNAIDSLISTHATDDNAHHEVFESSDFTTAFAAEDLNNLTTKSHDNLDDVSVDDHHSQAHVLSGTDHTASGLTAGWVISADTTTTFSWKAPTSEISGSGTYLAIPRWATTTSLGDSSLSENAGATELYASVGIFIGADATSPKIVNNADALELWSGSTPSLALTLDTSQNAKVEGYLTVVSTDHAGADVDKFLVMETGGRFKYRSGSEVYSDIDGYVTADFATDFAAEDLANLATAAHASLDDAPTDAHHSETHVLATTGVHSGTLPWTDLDKTGSSLADLATRTHANLSDAPTDAHHTESHVLSGSTHSATGLTVGWVIAADSATTFSWQAAPGGPGSGTQYTIPMWATTDTLGDSMISQDSGGTLATVNGDLKVSGVQVYGSGTTLAFAANTTTDGPYLMLYDGTNAIQFLFDNVIKLVVTSAGNLQIDGTLQVDTIAAGVADYDAFLVSDSGVVKFRTGTELASDIGAASVPLALTDLASYVQGSIIIGGDADWEALGAGTEDYVLKMGAAEPAWGQVDWSELTGSQPSPISHDFDVHTGDVDLVDIAGYAQGSIIKGGASDWESLVKGTENYVLKAGATDITWGTVDWSELSGSQPAPVAHNLIDTTGHPVSGLTGGHFLKALTTTTYGFAAHGLGAGDVGAYTTAEVDSAIDTDISTHAGDDNAHHEVIEQSDVETIITAELVDGQSIDLAIDSLILTHKNITGAHHTKWTTGDTEGVITAEIVDGQSIDNAIDALILTHKNIATAHQDAPTLISTHASDDNAHHEVIEQSDVETIISAELVNGQSIDLAIDSLILTHKNITSAHHAKWTTGDTEGVITAELVDGQSIDNAIDSLIDDHAGLPDIHHAQSHTIVSHSDASLADPGNDRIVFWDEDANFFKFLTVSTGLTIVGVLLSCTITQYTDAMVESVITAELVNGQSIDLAIDSLISDHAGDDNAHHALVTVTALPLTLAGQAVTFNYNTNHFKLTGNNLEIGTDTPGTDEVLKWNGSAAVWSTSAGGTDYDPDLAIGSGNATWINCPYEGAAATVHDDMDAYGRVTAPISAAAYYNYSVPLPTNRGGKKLYISGTRVSLSDADSANLVTNTYMRAHAATTSTNLDADPTDKQTVALHEDLSMGALDCSAYHKIALTLHCSTDDDFNLDIQFVTVRYYYA